MSMASSRIEGIANHNKQIEEDRDEEAPSFMEDGFEPGEGSLYDDINIDIDGQVKEEKERKLIEQKIVLHRLPYMKMDKKIMDSCTRWCFFTVIFLAQDCEIIGQILEVIGAFTASFNIMIYPGFFFYLANKERLG